MLPFQRNPTSGGHFKKLLSAVEDARSNLPAVARYGLALSFVAAALFLTLALQHFETRRPTLFLFFSAIVAAAWVGGVGPGMLAVALSVPAGLYFYASSAHNAPLSLDTFVLFLFFATSAAVGAMLNARQRRSQAALLDARTELARVTRATAMGEMAVSIAHEINQPLTATVISASACLRWLEATPPDLDEARDAARHVVRNGTRVSDVVKRIRAMVRKAPPEKGEIDVNALLREVALLMQAELQKHAVVLHMELDPRSPRLSGDKVQLQQVLLNLVTNAIEAMAAAPPARVLTLQSIVSGGEAIMIVRDTGAGIDPARREKLFDTFFTTKPGGVGLGLSICRSIVDAHGGRFWVGDTLPHGASFHVALPHREVGDGR